MTTEQRNEIIRLRNLNMGYTAIATQLDISKDTVKTYCKRNNIGGIRAEPKVESDGCPWCGNSVVSNLGCKPRRFCSDGCRKAWWNAHPERVTHKALYWFTCSHCGVSFAAYGNRNRKYCSHQCYVTARFKGGAES